MSNKTTPVKDYFVGKTTKAGVTRLAIYRRVITKKGRFLDSKQVQEENKKKGGGWRKAPPTLVKISAYFRLRDDVRVELKRLKAKAAAR